MAMLPLRMVLLECRSWTLRYFFSFFLAEAEQREVKPFDLDDLPDLEDVDISECGEFAPDTSLVSSRKF